MRPMRRKKRIKMIIRTAKGRLVLDSGLWVGSGILFFFSRHFRDNFVSPLQSTCRMMTGPRTQCGLDNRLRAIFYIIQY